MSAITNSNPKPHTENPFFVLKNNISQEKIDEFVVNFVIGTVQPLRIVESPSFIALVTGLQPQKSVLSRDELSKRINDRYEHMKQLILNQLNNVNYVGTTVDVWSAHHRSFLGITAHFIESTTLERKNFALACLRLRGKHDHQLLAQKISEVHHLFRIQNKVHFYLFSFISYKYLIIKY